MLGETRRSGVKAGELPVVCRKGGSDAIPMEIWMLLRREVSCHLDVAEANDEIFNDLHRAWILSFSGHSLLPALLSKE